jgi:hypothetical protein
MIFLSAEFAIMLRALGQQAYARALTGRPL